MFLPYSTERELTKTPWATIGLIGANVAVFIVQMSVSGATDALALDPSDFHWWQPLTSMFSHAGILHLAGNMWFLWIFGCHAEDTIGIPKYLLMYFTAGFGASGFECLTDLAFVGRLQGGLGASGAIMGVMALFVTRYRNVLVNFWYWYWYWMGTTQIKALWVAIFYVGMDVFGGMLSAATAAQGGVGHFAHIGGFICGLIWAFALRLPEEAADDDARDDARRLAASGSFALAAGALEAHLAKDPDDPDLHCQAANYLAMKDETRARAVEHWNKALSLWLAEGKKDEALECWRKLARTYQPQQFDPEVIFHVGCALEHAGDCESAAAAFNGVAGHHQDSRIAPVAALRLADILAKLGKSDSARSWYEYIATAWPASEEALEVGVRARHLI